MFPLAIAQQNNNKKAKTGIMNRRNCRAKEKRWFRIRTRENGREWATEEKKM
jgi:hypothetical protein